MHWDLAEPGDAGISEGGARVEAAGDGTGNKRPALLGQEPEHTLLRRHQRIQPRRLAVEVVGDGALLCGWRNRNQKIRVLLSVDISDGSLDGSSS